MSSFVRPGRRLAVLVPLAGLLLALMAAPAYAAVTGTASISGVQLVYTAANNVENAMVFDFLAEVSENRILIFDDAGRPTPGTGCFNHSAPKTVWCFAQVTVTTISLGDRDDNASVVDGNFMSSITVHGGAGDDWISAQTNGSGPTPVTFNGNDGNDTLNGGDAGDTLNGGNGQDALTGDGTAPGQPQGNDTLLGGADFDILEGLGGNDGLNGGAGADYYLGGTGNDLVHAHSDNQADWFVNCGPNNDTARRDSQDVAAGLPFTNCETVTL